MGTSGVTVSTKDAPAVSAGEGTEEFLARFDALAPGEKFRLDCTESPRALLACLQARRRGLFEWSLLGESRGTRAIEVFRRDAAAGEPRDVLQALAWDHDRLDELESAAFAARESGEFEAARGRYGEFACGLRRHIAFEEEILFPEFEQKAGFDSAWGPTAVMRQEHGEIRFLLDEIERAIGTAGPDALDLRRRFREVIAEHNEKEELVVYPGVDGLLSAAERDALFARIQAHGM